MNNLFNRCGQCGSNCPRQGEIPCGCRAEARNARSGCNCQRQAWTNRSEGCNCQRQAWTTRSAGCGCAGARNVEPRTGGCGTQAIENRASDCGCASQVNETRASGCGCGATAIENRSADCEKCDHGAVDTGILSGKSLAMVYSPYQNYEELYDPREGLCNGTIFCKLNKPFYGDRRN